MIISRNPCICATELDGEICLFDPDRAEYLNLNSTGSAIWNILEEPMPFDRLIKLLVQKYSVDIHQCKDDASLFIEASVAQGFLFKDEEQ